MKYLIGVPSLIQNTSSVFKKLNIELAYDTAIPLLCILSEENSKSKRYMHTYAHNNTIYNSQDKEGNKMFTDRWTFDRWKDKEDVRYISSVQSHSHVQLFATPWIAARQASLSITTSWSSLRLTSIESVMLSSHLILCRPLLLLPPIPPSIRVFSNESTLRMTWLKYWSFSFSIIPSKEIPGLISFRMDWFDLLHKGKPI